MLRLSRKPGSPFEIRIINWHIHVVHNSVLTKISQEVNPEVCIASCFTRSVLLYCILGGGEVKVNKDVPFKY